MKASDIMTKDVVAVTPETPVGQIARLMVENGYSGIPVVEGKRLVGLVTEIDLVARNAHLHFPTFIQVLDARIYLQNPRHFEEELRRILGTTAADVMTHEIDTVTPDAEVTDVATLMFEKKVNPVPVVVEDELVGILSRTDVIRLLVREEAE